MLITIGAERVHVLDKLTKFFRILRRSSTQVLIDPYTHTTRPLSVGMSKCLANNLAMLYKIFTSEDAVLYLFFNKAEK